METKCNFCSTEITGPSHHCPGLGKIVYQDGHQPREHQPEHQPEEPAADQPNQPSSDTLTPAEEFYKESEEQTTPDDKPQTEEPTTNTNWFSKIFKRN